MTGIERLRELARIWTWDCKMVVEQKKLADIADQIERERDEERSRWDDELCDAQMDKTCVMAVYLEMNTHVLGHEGMEDSPVARWARELREALGGNGRDPAEDVSMSAYDLLPQEDREAIAWVRERGGLERVKAQRRESMPRAAYERKKAGFLDHIAECERALGRRREIISELNHRASDLTRENAELRKRAMPEGYEWPRFESGEPVMLGDSVTEYTAGGGFEVRSIEFRDGAAYLREGFRTEGIVIVRPGERVNRPAPKVLDADGVEIRVGDRVWSTQLDEPNEWVVIDPHEDRDDSQTVLVSIGDRTGHARPENLTHQCPVLAADGKPIREGETAYAKNYDYAKCTVLAIEWVVDGYLVEVENEGGHKFRQTPDEFTHELPDSWERLEEDADRTANLFDAFDADASADIRDLVRRAKALAGDA